MNEIVCLAVNHVKTTEPISLIYYIQVVNISELNIYSYSRFNILLRFKMASFVVTSYRVGLTVISFRSTIFLALRLTEPEYFDI